MKTTIGVSGEVGSFSEEAALLYTKNVNITPALLYLIDMEGVLDAIEKDEIELGIFPVVNIHGGLVTSAFQAMGKHLFTPIFELWFNVQQCLLVLPGTSRQKIDRIVSHPQGLAQCKHYLEEEFKNCELIQWCDTAKAAKDLAMGILPKCCAVIAPARCAEIYGLEIMAQNIQDNNPNLTAFILVKK